MASSVKLGEKLESLIDELVENGRYGSRSEVLREGVRLVHERESWVAMVQERIAEARSDVAAGRVHSLDDVRTDLRQRFGSPV